MAARIVAETGGNPLAVVEAARELTPEQLGGRVPLPEPLPVGHRLEAPSCGACGSCPRTRRRCCCSRRRARRARDIVLWQAAAALGIPESAAAPAEAAGLVVFWPEVRFFHPLVRSAVYHARHRGPARQAHRALAAACDPELDAVPRAWHLAAAAARPDEGVAAELEAAAERARSRGGYAATATLLECAAQLTPDEQARAERQLSAAQAHVLAGTVDRADALLGEATRGLGNPLSAAQATRLRGRIHATCGTCGRGRRRAGRCGRRLRPLDPRAARDALLSALESAAFAGWASSASLLDEIGGSRGDLPPPGDPPDSAPNLLLRG